MDLHNPNVIGTLTLEGGAQVATNVIEQLNTKVEVTDSGADGQALVSIDGQTAAIFTDTRVDLYDDGVLVCQTYNAGNIYGISVLDGAGENLNVAVEDGQAWIWSGEASSHLELGVYGSGDTYEAGVAIKADGAVELYHNNIKVSETTANGITGAVWG